MLFDYKSDVKLFNSGRGYMGIDPYVFSRGSTFHFAIDGAEIFKCIILGLIFLFLF